MLVCSAPSISRASVCRALKLIARVTHTHAAFTDGCSARPRVASARTPLRADMPRGLHRPLRRARHTCTPALTCRTRSQGTAVRLTLPPVLTRRSVSELCVCLCAVSVSGEKSVTLRPAARSRDAPTSKRCASHAPPFCLFPSRLQCVSPPLPPLHFHCGFHRH